MNQKIKISEFSRFEFSDYLKTDGDQAQYLAIALESGDIDLLIAVKEDIAKAKVR
jgi:DNA-binding phage protein